MRLLLFADAERSRGLVPFVEANWLLLLPPLLGFLGIYLLLPRARRMPPIWGGLLTAFAVVFGAFLFVRTDTVFAETLLFYAFAGIAVTGGIMMIAQSNPVHAALSFALVVLSTCGLFLLQAAPFLMAATIIIYAGAIVVTFLFVIMLAHQEGVSNADQRSREPFLATLAGCVLMTSLLCVLQKTYDTRGVDDLLEQLQQLSEAKDDTDVKRLMPDPPTKEEPIKPEPKLVSQLKKHFGGQDAKMDREIGFIQITWAKMQVADLSNYAGSLRDMIKTRRDAFGSLTLNNVPGKSGTPGHFAPGKLPARNIEALGRTLFSDYLIGVEMAATLLLVATIGAILIAGRRLEELR